MEDKLVPLFTETLTKSFLQFSFFFFDFSSILKGVLPFCRHRPLPTATKEFFYLGFYALFLKLPAASDRSSLRTPGAVSLPKSTCVSRGSVFAALFSGVLPLTYEEDDLIFAGPLFPFPEVVGSVQLPVLPFFSLSFLSTSCSKPSSP